MSVPCRILLVLLSLVPPSAARGQVRSAHEGLARDPNSRGLPPLTPPLGPRRMALCIGINGYACEGYPALSCAVADAKDVGRALQTAGFDVTVMTDDADDALRPTAFNLTNRMAGFIRGANHPDDTVVIAFFGHGVEGGGKVSLLPLDFLHNEVPLGPVIEGLSSCLARKKLLVLDPCRSRAEKPAAC